MRRIVTFFAFIVLLAELCVQSPVHAAIIVGQGTVPSGVTELGRLRFY